MTHEVTKTVLNKIILNVWIESGQVLEYGPGIELAFRSTMQQLCICTEYCAYGVYYTEYPFRQARQRRTCTCQFTIYSN
jgi:hypothetical protein